jgi:hypothetical protein
MKILAFIFLVAGVILFFIKRKQSQLMLNLRTAHASNIKELEHTAQAIATQIGGGSWRDYVKIWGKITVSKPLYSELKKEPCVYYTMSVKREYEERIREKNQEGNWVERTVRKSETVASNQLSIPFILEDKTGTIEVNPENAQIDTIKIVDEFRQGEVVGNMISYGNFSQLLNNSIKTSQTHTLGYHYRESILPVGRDVLVLGTVNDETGNLRISKPVSNEQKFLISLKSSAVLIEEINQSEKNIHRWMIGCFVAAFFCWIFG